MAEQPGTGAKLSATQQAATIRMIGYPLGTVVAALERGDTVSAAALNVRMSLDHAQAAYFVAQDFDKISVHWQGSDTDLEFLAGFVAAFPDLNEKLPPAPEFTRSMP